MVVTCSVLNSDLFCSDSMRGMTGKEKNSSRIEGMDVSSDEPTFVLRARDPQAANLVRLWAEGRDFLHGSDDPKVAEALACAQAMEQWRTRNDATAAVEALTLLPFEMLAAELRRRGAIVSPCGYEAELGGGEDLGL